MSIRTPQSGIQSPSGSIEHTRFMAAKWSGVDVVRFYEEVDPWWQAKIIAHYILDSQMQAVLQQDHERKQRSKNRHIGNSKSPG